MVENIFNKKHIALSLVLITTLAVFYPVLSARLINLDDTQLIHDLNDTEKNHSLKNLFFRSSINRYYRPFLALTFIVDSKIWLFEPSGYHLTNYLIHTLNALLLFFIGLKIFDGFPKTGYLAMVSALLFSIHPLTCESVAWVSGRSDILATFFCLLAFNFYLSRLKGRALFVILSTLLGLMTKESTLAIIPIIPICHFFSIYKKDEDFSESIKSTMIWLTILLIPLVIYLYLRMNGLSHFDNGIKLALSTDLSSSHSGFNSLFFHGPAALVFYLKKLFFPFPLNFAIHRINVPVYFFFSILMVLSSVYLLIRKQYSCLIWLTLIVIAFSPAILVAASKMAWTAYAERYLYLAIAVWAIAMGMLISHFTGKWARIFEPAVISILLIFAVTTFSRTLVWQNALTLWEDTYQKSPHHGKVLYKYGTALGEPEGTKYFMKAVETARDEEWKDFSLLALAGQAKKDGRYARAKDYLNRALLIKSSPKNYIAAAGILKSIPDKKDGHENENLKKAVEYYQKAYQKRRDPFCLFQIATLQVTLKDFKQAQLSFKEIINKFPSSPYADYSKPRLKSING